MKKRWLGIVLCCLAVAGLFSALLSQMPIRKEKVAVELKIPASDGRDAKAYQKWSEPVIQAAKSVAVQEDGRIKPLSTVGRFHLLSLSGKSKAYYLSDEGKAQTMTPTEWILDCIFRPQFAAQMRVFLIEDSVVLEEIGMPDAQQRKRRDLYSYQELAPFKAKLLELALVADGLKGQQAELNPLQKKILALRDRMVSFERLNRTFAFGGQVVPVGSEVARRMGFQGDYVSFVDFLQISYLFLSAADQSAADGGKELERLRENAQLSRFIARESKLGLAILAPLLKPDAEWATYGHLIESLNKGEGRNADGSLNKTGEQNFRDVRQGGSLYYLANWDLAGFESEFLAWAEQRQLEAARIPDPDKPLRMVSERIVSEVSYYGRHYLHYGMGFFLLAFLFVGIGWLAPSGRFGWITRMVGLVLIVLGTAAVGGAVIHRSFIMWRPPVGNLFDTIPFIVATGGLVVVVIELITRRGLAIGIGSVFGILGVFLAMRYEAGTGQDTMTPLVAVLRSNYWLTTHVITVTLGYMGALLAAAISHVYLIGRVTGLDGGDRSLRRALTRMTYGVVGFALLFSMVGTILGGVWANDSWGRFWGWDPKENGALMIVLMNLIILHARIGGLVKEFGVHILAVLGAIVVGFSWWGVNMLGVGLHSYGFTDGASTLYLFYLIEVGVIVFSLLGFWISKSQAKARNRANAAGAELKAPLDDIHR